MKFNGATGPALTHQELYPTGRKFCTGCGRWRLIIDFSCRKWADPERTIALQFATRCRACNAKRNREQTGNKPREWYPHGNPHGAKWNEHRNEQHREYRRRRMSDPKYRAAVNEYGRIWRDAKRAAAGKQPRFAVQPTKIDARYDRCDPKPFLDWFDGLTDKPVLPGEEHALVERARNGTTETISEILVDRIMTRYGAADEFNLLYPFEEELSDAA